jgi:hypothetical protein
VRDTNTYIQIDRFRHKNKQRQAMGETNKRPDTDNSQAKRVRETKTYANIQILTFKATKTGIEISKHPPRHTTKESERDKSKYNYIDSIIEIDKDKHEDRLTPTQTHRQRE